ncbi:hypothetical protein D3C72_1119010 [compost metagenome]
MAHDVFAHDDGVIDQHADGQRQAQQSHEVQGKAAQPHGNEGGNHGRGQAQRRDQGRTPGVQKGVDDENRQHGAQHQRFDHIVQAMLGIFTAVARHLQQGALRQGLVDFRHHVADLVGHADGGRVAHAGDGNAHVGLAAAHAQAVDFGKAIFDGGHLRQAHDFLATALDHDFLEVAWRLDAAHEADAFLVQDTAHLAHGGIRVLIAQSGHDVADGHIVFTQFFRAQQHGQFALERTAHVDQRHAIDGAEAVRQHVLGQARNFRMALRIRRQRQLHDRLGGRVNALQDRLAHFRRQLVAHGGNRIADIVGRFDQVGVEGKLQEDAGRTFI